MKKIIIEDQTKSAERFYKSDRLTIQQDPITYNDEIASFFGAKPNLWENKDVAFRLIFSSCGPAQWRLNGPDSDKEMANGLIKKVPLTPMMNLIGLILIGLILIFCLILTFKHPFIFSSVLMCAFIYYLSNKLE